MCTDTQYPSVVKEEPAFLCTVSVYSLVYPVYVRVRLNICKIRDQPPLQDDLGQHMILIATKKNLNLKSSSDT